MSEENGGNLRWFAKNEWSNIRFKIRITKQRLKNKRRQFTKQVNWQKSGQYHFRRQTLLLNMNCEDFKISYLITHGFHLCSLTHISKGGKNNGKMLFGFLNSIGSSEAPFSLFSIQVQFHSNWDIYCYDCLFYQFWTAVVWNLTSNNHTNCKRIRHRGKRFLRNKKFECWPCSRSIGSCAIPSIFSKEGQVLGILTTLLFNQFSKNPINRTESWHLPWWWNNQQFKVYRFWLLV